MLGSGEQKLVTSEKRILRIGRLPSSEIFIDDPVVSRRHAEVYLADEGYFVRDTGSRNGTFIGDKETYKDEENRTYRHELQDGDYMLVGETTLVFKKL